VLVDGVVRCRWKLHREKRAARLELEAAGKLTRGEIAQVGDEGARLLAFLAPDESQDVTYV
jgi:hypothetical protein